MKAGIPKPKYFISFLSLYCCISLFNVQVSGTDEIQPENKPLIENLPMIDLSDSFIYNTLRKYLQYFDSALINAEKLKIQIIYTQVDHHKRGKLSFTDHSFNLDAGNYFYPASTVKLPVAILALQKLNELKIPGLDKNTTMITGEAGYRQTPVNEDPSAVNGKPSIAQYIKKILLVSDNDAFNRLYEFLGQEYINNSLHKMGYRDIQIIHRLSVSMTEEENRHTNPVSFIDPGGRTIYTKTAEISKLQYTARDTKMGTGYMQGDRLVREPFDFSQKNRLSLQDLHMIVRSIIYPGSVEAGKRFNLTHEDYDFLRKYMSMQPDESAHPLYDATEYWDTYAKFLFYGKEKNAAIPGIRIFNKVGNAYGFLTDAVYVADFENKIEFFLSATVYCNSDGIFNDDKYDYETTGYPFLKNLGKVIYEYERTRVRKKLPDLSTFRYNYRE